MMKLFKLDAVNSTNVYLKDLVKSKGAENWTVVSAEYQTNGRGQVETKWDSEKGKNLMFSILVGFLNLEIKNQFYLNCAISMGVYNALLPFNLPQLCVKWPNDIMAGNKKIGGILIENSLKGDKIYQSIVGIGLNINQSTFSEDLPNASSLKKLLQKDFDKELILEAIITSIKFQIFLLESGGFKALHCDYENAMYQKGKVRMYKNKEGLKFLGKIIEVTKTGLLVVEKEDETLAAYDFKEIVFF